MKKLLSLTALLAAFGLHAQENWCGTEANWDKHYKSQGIENWQDMLHERMIRAKSAESFGADRAASITIPVVVHIIHDGAEGNISMEQVESAIAQLNEDYQRLNADTVDTRNTANAPFEPVAANMDIEFKLAKLDPDGQCTNGVERRFSPSATVSADDDVKHWASGGLDAWNRNNYFNIWVVSSIASSGGGTTLGYAYLPYFGVNSNFGVLIRHDAFGTTGTASTERTLSHEVGHSLGLLHTFETSDECTYGACDGDGDYCCDTPPVFAPQWSCSPTQNTCIGIPTGDLYGFDAYDQFENFMSYSPCQNMFSKDQADIVNFNLGDVGMFVTLTSAANLTNTGVDLPDVLCKADFSYDKEIVCAGSSVQFTDMSYSNVTGWNWSFPGGTPSSSTDPNPVVTYNTGGVYSVTLEVTDGSSTESVTLDDIISVLSVPGTSLPYHEGFETVVSVPDNQNWMTVNADGGQQFTIYTGAGSSGVKSCRLNNFGIGNGSIDELISGPIDLGDVAITDDMVCTFKYAYRRRSASNDEILRFYVSKDCGETWVLRKQLKGDVLGPEIKSSSYTPADASEWYTVSIDNIGVTYYVENFMFKFQFTNDQGNNLYIDDINLYPASMASIEDSEINSMSVFPNPVSDILDIQLDLLGIADAEVVLQNALGQKVAAVFEGQLNVGQSTLKYSMTDLPAGVYYVRVNYGESTEVVKVVKR